MIGYIQYAASIAHRYIWCSLLALFLLVFQSAGQERVAAGSLEQDTIRINRYLRTANRQTTAPDLALKVLDTAYALARKHGLKSEIGRIWGSIGQANMRQGEYATAKLYLDSAFRLSEQLKDGELICYLNSIAALMYQNSSDYAKAATHYFRALETIKAYDLYDSHQLTGIYNNLATLMFSLNEDTLARKYLLLSQYHLLRRSPVDSAQLTYLLINIAQTYFNSESPESIDYFRKAYDQVKNRHDTAISYHILINLTMSYVQQEQFDSGRYYLKLARSYATTNPDLVKVETIAGLLSYYKKDYSSAIRHFELSMDLDKENDNENMDETYLGLSWVYEELKQYQKAHHFLKQYQELVDKMEDDNEQIAGKFMVEFQSLEHERAMMKKRTEILAQKAAIKKRNLWIAAMFTLSVLLTAILVLAYRNYRNKQILLNERMKALQQHQEIEQLKAEARGADKERTRIAYDLHDGIMTRLTNIKMSLNAVLATLPGFTKNNHYPDIIGQLELATQELRNTAHNLMPEILLEDGVEHAIFYFCKATEQASGLTIKFQQMGDPLPRLQTSVETSVYRIVQELIQNIIRHAQATTALVQLQYRDGLCAITVEDDGRSGTAFKIQEGYGLKGIRNRIKVLQGTFDIESNDEYGTTAYTEFDVRPFLADEPEAQQASGV